jgi:glutaredoxin
LKKVRSVHYVKKHTTLFYHKNAEGLTLLRLDFYRQCYLLLVFLFFTLPTAYAIETQEIVIEKPFLEVFVRDGCPHCAEAKQFLPSLAKQYPQLRKVIHSIDKDSVAKEALITRSKEAGVWPPGVPTFIIADTIHVGFKSASETGPELVALLSREVPSTINTITQPPQTIIDSQVLGNISVERVGLPVFTLVIGLLDGLPPVQCGFYCFCCRFLFIYTTERKWQ